MSFEQEKKHLNASPISSEAEALRQAVLLSMRPSRRETTQQNDQEGTTIIAHPQQTRQETTLAIKNDGYITPPLRRSLPFEECVTPEDQILNTPAILAFSPEEGEYLDSGEGESDEDDFQRFRPRTNPFDIMQVVANGTNYERTAGNLFQRYLEESPEMAWAFDGTVVSRRPMEVDFEDDSDADDDDARTCIRRWYRVPTPCPQGEDLTPTNYILDDVEVSKASQNNGNGDRMQVGSEEQANENVDTVPDNYVAPDRRDNTSPILHIVNLNSPSHVPDTIDGSISDNSGTNNATPKISGEISPILGSTDQMSKAPNISHVTGEIQVAGCFSPTLTHTTDDIQRTDDFSQIGDNSSPVLACTTDDAQRTDDFPICNENDNVHRLSGSIVNTAEESIRMKDIHVSEIESPVEEGEIEEGEIIESEMTSDEHVVQVKNADEEARELMKELYEEYGAQPFDIIEEGIPIDVVIRFTRELNHRLPPELEVFSVVTTNGKEQTSSLTQVNTVSPSIEPKIKLEPVEDNLPIINNVEQHENPLISTIITSSQAEPMDRPFMVSREQNFIIDLSDSSDEEEHHIAGLLKEVKSSLKSSLSGNGTQMDAKRKLEEKEREIRRMNELIASKTEFLKKKSIITQQTLTLTSSNTGTSIDMIRAELETFETAKSHVSEVKSRLNEEEKRLESIRSEVANIDIKIGESSSLAKQYVEQMKSYDIKKGQMIHKREEIECRIRTLQDELARVQSQFDNVDKEKESAAIGLAKKEEEYAQQLRTKEQHLEQEGRVVENVVQIKKQLGLMLKDIKVKKERLSQMVAQSTKTRNESTMSESSPSVYNKNGKRGVIYEREETPKKPKLALEVAELSKKIEQVSKEQQSLRESLEKKRQGDVEMSITKKNQNSGPENEWRAEKIASQEAISEHQYEVFRPYESPLMGFRSFRFHPEYVEVVSDDKSFTYNNNIVPNKKMCAFELQPRGICNDDDCRSQHFRELPKTEKEVIDDLTGYYEGENISQQRHYREGLHRLLGDLEMSGRDSFFEKFEEIKKYRGTFIARSQNDGTGAPRVVFTNQHRPLTDDRYISPPIRESESDYVSESLPTPRMPTSSSSGQDDDQPQIYLSSPELDDDDDDGDYFSPSSVHHEKDLDENEKYESYNENIEAGQESDDQFAELRESDSSDFESEEEENRDELDIAATRQLDRHELQEEVVVQTQDQQEEQDAYAPLGYVGRIINWFL